MSALVDPVFMADDTARWAATTLRALVPDATQVPVYGSPAWAALPAESPLRLAAAIRAAEARRTEISEDIAALVAEYDVRQRAARQRTLDDQVATIVSGTARRLVVRRPARDPEDDRVDYPGGPVPAW